MPLSCMLLYRDYQYGRFNHNAIIFIIYTYEHYEEIFKFYSANNFKNYFNKIILNKEKEEINFNIENK